MTTTCRWESQGGKETNHNESPYHTPDTPNPVKREYATFGTTPGWAGGSKRRLVRPPGGLVEQSIT